MMPGKTNPRTDQPPIGDYAVIGDCRTAALVSRTGSIDWCCLPRFDSASVFGALLDTERGGAFHVRPAVEFDAERRYLPGTNVLETTFRCADGVLRLTDAMTISTGDGLVPDHEILRRLECTDGSVPVDALCDPRFDYGRKPASGRLRGRLGVQFDGGGVGLALRSDLPFRRAARGPGWRAADTLSAGDRRYLSLTAAHANPLALCPLGDDADDRLATTAGWWRDWLEDCAYEGEYQELVFRSMLTLKLLMFAPSGAILAAATTSLPEVPGGSRNWDYRYCWLRDASMTLGALLHLGFAAEGESFLAWLLHATRLTRPELQILYDVYGRTELSSTTLGHLAGYRGATPVRVGNDATQQFQLDIYGEVIRAAWSFVELGGELDEAEAGLMASLGRTICRRWEEPDNGIWEVRGERRHYTHSKALCWVGLRCLLDLHDRGSVELDRDPAEIRAIMGRIRDRTEREGWSDDASSYVAWYGADQLDAALLLLGLLGYEDPKSHRMESTRKAIRSRLGEGPHLRRYRYDDHLPGREGAFGICAFWEAQLLARQRRVDEACERFEAAATTANDLGLFAEEVDADSGELLGNFPQAFTHIGLVSAANEIARARGRPPEERAPPPESTEAESR